MDRFGLKMTVRSKDRSSSKMEVKGHWGHVEKIEKVSKYGENSLLLPSSGVTNDEASQIVREQQIVIPHKL